MRNNRVSAYFSVPTINIGRRQEGRLKDKNVFDVDHDIKKIYNKINHIISIQNDFKKKFKCKKFMEMEKRELNQ